MTCDPNALIQAIAAAADEVARARLLRDAARDLLADPGAIADVADAALAPPGDTTAQAADALLGCALDEARMARENGAPEGAALIDALAAAVTARDAAQPLTPVQRLHLAQAHARAGLAPPPFAMLSPGVMAEAGETTSEMPDLDALLGPLIAEIGDAPLQVHAALTELLAGLPPEPAAMLVSAIVVRPGALEARLGLHWLLDPRSVIRLAAATALRARAEAGTLAPALAGLLPALRKVLPDDPARTTLDGVIRQQMRHGATAAPVAKVHRAAASLPDGAGAQSLVAAVQIGARHGVAMAMLKQGHGLKDAFVIPCASATEQEQMLAHALDQIETFDIPPDALTDLLAHGLGEGTALERMPAPGLVDLAEIFGPDALAPRAGGAADLLESLGAADALTSRPAARHTALLKASADLVHQFANGDSWFEDAAPLRDAIARARTDKGRETAVWKHLETRRDWWARHFALCATVLKHAADLPPEPWLTCAAVAQSLLDGRSARRIPVMSAIVEMTLDAEAARSSAQRLTPGAGPQPDIRTLLADEGITPAFLQGYLTALVIAPREPPPGDWLGPLLGGIEFPEEGTLDHALDLIRDDLERLDRTAGDPKATAGRIATLDDEDLCDWANGFDDLLEAAPRAWPARQLAADDKRVLHEIEQVADGADGSTLRAVLPSWVAQRHARRQ